MVEGRTHRPLLHPSKCRSCDICLRGCPAEWIPEYRKEEESLRGTLYREKMADPPSKGRIPLPPCQEACPIHQDARGYVALIAKGKYREALDLIREVNPLPGVCGYICHHPCEEACLREGVDRPVPIRLLKRFIAEQGRSEQRWKVAGRMRRERILVVGSGPAGLACANDLTLKGFRVTLFEALPVLGGMLRVGIPSFRLPREVLEMEVEGIRRLGVEMEVNRPFRLEGDGTILQRSGFDAIFLSMGAHRSLRLNIPGESLQGVHPGVEFLRKVNLGRKVETGSKVAVIGGGNVAIDVARCLLRLGAKRIDLYYRRSRREMPAIAEEVDQAVREGVRLHFLTAPVRITGRAGRVSGMECIRMRLAEPDETGRRRPVPVEGSNFTVEADMIIPAIGQGIDSRYLKGLERNPDGTVRVDEKGQTNLKGVFAGGDMVTGPGWAIEAIAAGKRGAEAIAEYLR
ncbi:MAG: FAD-dependent oxidoreductase [Desulfobacterota bacterium]|nr:FAD-dependent oxidoreductase [Thermodesulfobacteriota bacterium]